MLKNVNLQSLSNVYRKVSVALLWNISEVGHFWTYRVGPKNN